MSYFTTIAVVVSKKAAKNLLKIIQDNGLGTKGNFRVEAKCDKKFYFINGTFNHWDNIKGATEFDAECERLESLEDCTDMAYCRYDLCDGETEPRIAFNEAGDGLLDWEIKINCNI